MYYILAISIMDGTKCTVNVISGIILLISIHYYRSIIIIN